MMTELLPFAFGGPPLQGVLRASPEDFVVDEDLGVAPDGAGEHVFVRIEKRGANTDWVGRELAQFAGVAMNAISYAGLKDRHALTRQTFSVHLPGKPDPDWATLHHPEFRVLDASRHSRKLQRGALQGNRFRIVVRDIRGDCTAVQRRVELIRSNGVPNFFGEQRFGRGGDNVRRAVAMFQGKRVARHERSLLLSAARSHLFNCLLSERVQRGNWQQPLDGEVWMLAGSHSIFGPEPLTPVLSERHARGDIDLTGPLWGAGDLRSCAQVRQMESDIAAAHPQLVAGLIANGLHQQRRILALRPQDFIAQWKNEDSLELSFYLSAGSYATAVLREVVQYGPQSSISE